MLYYVFIIYIKLYIRIIIQQVNKKKKITFIIKYKTNNSYFGIIPIFYIEIKNLINTTISLANNIKFLLKC